MISLAEFAGIVMGVVFSLLTFVEVLPIKISPWGWLARMFGRAINSDVLQRVELLSSEVRALDKSFKRQRAENCRARIVRFGDELLHNARHSKEHFDQILIDIAAYEQYCAANPDFINGVTGMTVARIKQVYAECLREHNFL